MRGVVDGFDQRGFSLCPDADAAIVTGGGSDTGGHL
jgi:hypothetical protein